jgi:hypothetical protein
MITITKNVTCKMEMLLKPVMLCDILRVTLTKE